MSQEVVWLLAFGTLLLAYCLYWGIAAGRGSGKAQDFFLAGRQTPAWVFVLSATGLSLTGWMVLGHPSMLSVDGFPYGEVALGAIVIPLAGILFLKRQWLLGQRFGYATPGAMFADYYRGELIRLLTVLIALVFAIPFVGMQLAASGRLIQILTRGAVGAHPAMWVLGFSVFVYVFLGGMRAVTTVGALQCLLMLAGMIGLGAVAYYQLGGFGAFNAALARFGAQGSAAGSNLFEIPGVIQFTAGLGKQAPAGGIWTASMILTYSFALMGIQSSPSFSMLGFSCRDTRGFAPQQVWATGAIVGLVLLFFATAYGLGMHALSASPGAASTLLPALYDGQPVDVSTAFIRSISARHPWTSALLGLCVVAAVQMAAAAYVLTTASMFTTDIYQRFFRPSADDRAQRRMARATMAVIFIVALTMATFTPLAQWQLGGLALSFSLQLWPVLAGVCWLPWITRQAATVGVCVGLVVVMLTEPVGASILGFLGVDLPWGRWPWTIHSAGWGIFFNVLACALVSLATRGDANRSHRDGYHQYLHARAGLSRHKQVMKPAVWALILGWMFFAIGPGAVLGNDLFGDPAGGIKAWKLGIPSLWAWQIIWWALGVFVIWWLACKMEFSTSARETTDFGTKRATPS